MKLDVTTLKILKNFSTINPNLLFRVGNVIDTIDNHGTMFAKATLPVTFEKRFAIYKLDQLISTLSILDDPEIEFFDNYLEIKSGNTTVKFGYCDEDSIIIPKYDVNEITDVDASFNLTNDDFKKIERALGIMSLTEVVFLGDGEDVYIQAVDSKSPTSNIFSILIGKTTEKFKLIINAQLLKILPMDYRVEVTSTGFANFIGENVSYVIPVNYNSAI